MMMQAPQPPAFPDQPTAPKTNTLLKQLGFWTLHCSLTALPSFFLAVQYFKGPAAIAAMLLGVLTFILTYGFFTSTSFYGKVHQGLLGRSVKLGSHIRMGISLISFPFVLMLLSNDGNLISDISASRNDSEYTLFIPDFWFGFAAVIIVSMIYNIMNMGNPVGMNPGADGEFSNDFLSTYLITLVEGALISISLLLIAFVILIFLSFRKNRRQLPSQHFEQMPPSH